MRIMVWTVLTRVTLICLVGVWGVAVARAQVSFAGETVNIIISAPPGCGTDVSARLLGNFLGKYLPGEPSVRYRNIPGGGGITANNYFYRDAPADGLTLLVGSSSLSDLTRTLR